jgi:hypothetical protein
MYVHLLRAEQFLAVINAQVNYKYHVLRTPMRTACVVTMDRLLSFLGLVSALIAGVPAQYYGNYYCQSGRDVVVHLFEWKWTDIEKECSWLAANDFCAVQVTTFLCCIQVTKSGLKWQFHLRNATHETEEAKAIFQN